MKKTAFFAAAFLLVFSFVFPSFAFESQDKLTPAPEITEAHICDGFVDVSLVHSLNEAEELRKTVYDLALGKYKTEEALLSSPEKYLASPTCLYLQISPDQKSWKTVRNIAGNSFSLSLEDDLRPLTNANSFTFFIRVLMASENFTEEGIDKIYIYNPSKPVLVCVNESTIIPCEIPLKLTQPTTEKIALFTPQRTGYIFDGWSEADGTRIGFIPEGTKEITLKAHFIPRTYEINYVFKTNISYSAGFVDNTKNPVYYTVGTAERLYVVNSPIAGYQFDGWYTSPDFSGEEIKEISAFDTGDKILYAKWISDEELAQQKYEQQLLYIKENHLGDPDGDGKTTAADARYVLRCVVGLEERDYEKLKRVDYFNSNRILAENARITLRISVGLESLYDILLENGLLPQ